MTAINVFIRPDAVHVLTDGAGYAPDGRLLTIEQKVIPLASLSVVLAARGIIGLLHLYAEQISKSFTTFDGLVEGVTAEVWKVIEHSQGKFSPGILEAHFDLIIAGWSERRDRAEMYLLCNHDTYGIPAWELAQADDGYISPGSEELFARLRARGVDVFEKLDPETDGLRIIEEQRGMTWPPAAGGEPIRVVGGFCQLTTVRRDEITTRILKRWPDRIGERIDAIRETTIERAA